MIRIILAMTICLLTDGLFAQKHDYNYIHTSSGLESDYGFSINYDENTEDIVIDTFNWNGRVSFSPVFSDKDGNFLFYTNTLALWDSIGRLAINGDSMAVGFYQNFLLEYYPSSNGYGVAQSAAIIPITDSLFYLFHSSIEAWQGAPNWQVGDIQENGVPYNAYSEGLWLTKVRLREDGRIYIRPEEKKVQILDDLLAVNEMTFIKQNNGKDWWILLPMVREDSAHYYSLKVEQERLEYMGKQFFSPDNGRVSSITVTASSPNGERMARFYNQCDRRLMHKLELFNFDRCTGKAERYFIDSLPITEAPSSCAGDIEFSDNGRFLYVAIASNLLQLDMELDNPFSHIDTVGSVDTFLDFGLPPTIDQLWKLPNGKILSSSFNSTSFMHWIHNPNEKGDDCNFELRGLQAPPNPLNPDHQHLLITNLPTYPPYRMPPLDYPCEVPNRETTIKDAFITLYPNPANQNVQVQVHGTKIVQAFVRDLFGRTIFQSEKGLFDVSKLHNGLYLIHVKTTKGDFMEKLMVQ